MMNNVCIIVGFGSIEILVEIISIITVNGVARHGR